ncbi:MAG: hypothetical protein JXQ96_20470 [Cyclobacteriaceae bacterium]
MGLLTPEQLRVLRVYLESHGLSYEALQTEMLDHICCDLEIYMDQGISFEEALEKVKNEIPKNQFKKIQTETMEAIDKRITPTRRLTYTSFGSLIMATIFKLYHLPGAAALLISSFIILGITLLTGVFTNPLIREKERGRGVLLIFTLSMVAYLSSLCFQLLHLPGAEFLRAVSVTSSIVILSGYAIYAFINPEKVKNHILVEHIQKEAWNIEKVLLVLFGFGISLKLWNNDFVSIVFFMMFFAFGVVFYFVRSWPFLSSKDQKPATRLAFLIVAIISYFLFMAPTMLSLVDVSARIFMIWSTLILVTAAVGVYYCLISDDKYKYVLGALSFLLSIQSILNLLGKSFLADSIQGEALVNIAYSPGILICMGVLFLAFFKKPTMRALLLTSLAMYIHTYQMAGI